MTMSVDTESDDDGGTYTLMVTREFIAQHYLTVPDPTPPEGDVHSHQFKLEIELTGDSLGEYSYLTDITQVECLLDEIENRYRDTLLNDLSEFEGYNPSIERFARVIATRVREQLLEENIKQIEVRVWEDDLAWASYQTES